MDEGDTKKVPDGERRKPPAAGIGRPKGCTNKVTRALKEAILLGAEQAGDDVQGKGAGMPGYFRWLAREQPAVFGPIVSKILPQSVTGEDGEAIGPVQVQVTFVRPDPAD